MDEEHQVKGTDPFTDLQKGRSSERKRSILMSLLCTYLTFV